MFDATDRWWEQTTLSRNDCIKVVRAAECRVWRVRLAQPRSATDHTWRTSGCRRSFVVVIHQLCETQNGSRFGLAPEDMPAKPDQQRLAIPPMLMNSPMCDKPENHSNEHQSRGAECREKGNECREEQTSVEQRKSLASSPRNRRLYVCTHNVGDQAIAGRHPSIMSFLDSIAADRTLHWYHRRQTRSDASRRGLHPSLAGVLQYKYARQSRPRERILHRLSWGAWR
jgi:hypothetical protein